MALSGILNGIEEERSENNTTILYNQKLKQGNNFIKCY